MSERIEGVPLGWKTVGEWEVVRFGSAGPHMMLRIVPDNVYELEIPMSLHPEYSELRQPRCGDIYLDEKLRRCTRGNGAEPHNSDLGADKRRACIPRPEPEPQPSSRRKRVFLFSEAAEGEQASDVLLVDDRARRLTARRAGTARELATEGPEYEALVERLAESISGRKGPGSYAPGIRLVLDELLNGEAGK